MIKKCQDAQRAVQDEVYDRSNKQLGKIALRPNVLSNTDYLDLLVQAEEKGYKDRIEQFTKIRGGVELFKSMDLIAKSKEAQIWIMIGTTADINCSPTHSQNIIPCDR